MGPVGCFGQIENIKRQSLDIVEGSGEAGRTIHDNAPYHGWFGVRIKKFMKTMAVQTAETIHPAWHMEKIRSPRS